MATLFKLPKRSLSPALGEASPATPGVAPAESDEKSIRIGKSKAGRGEERAARSIPAAMKKLHSLLRQSAGRRTGKKNMGGRGRMPPGAPFGAQALQRVAVRATYAKPKAPGQWAAHGKYLERESANGSPGFGPGDDEVPLSETLGQWQEAGDPRLWKLIVSPENPGIDLREFTREYMKQMEADFGVPIQWVAQDHHNTDQPHVHIALRGVDAEGRELRIDPEYIKKGMRLRAQQEATRRLGLRTERDVLMAAERDVGKSRYTDLDRRLKLKAEKSGIQQRRGGNTPEEGDVWRVVDYSAGASSAMDLSLIKRLAHLETMGLADRVGERMWALAPHMESALRQRQKADDRLKMMFEHREVASDPRMPVRAIDRSNREPIRGRLIATGADDATGNPYMLVESPAGEVLYFMQNDRISEARNKGLPIGSFVEIGEGHFNVRVLGDAKSLAADPAFMRDEARRYVEQRGELPAKAVYGGWVGNYQAALHAAAKSLGRETSVERPRDAEQKREPARRGPDRSSR